MHRALLVATAALLSASCHEDEDTPCARACDRVLACGAETCAAEADCSRAEVRCAAQCVIEASCQEVLESIARGTPRGQLESCSSRCVGPGGKDGGVAASYQAYPAEGGPFCGEEPGGAHETARCKRGDNCVDPNARLCRPATAGEYQAYPDVFEGGPFCGEEPGGAHETARCKRGDNCVDPSARRCRPSTTLEYQAYPDAFGGGPFCGEDLGGAHETARCAQGDKCVDAPARKCLRG